MPLKCEDAPQCNECVGFCWLTKNEDALAGYVAQLLAGQAEFIEKIANGGSKPTLKLSKASLRSLRKALASGQPDELRWIRDGWLFQMISWIAVRMNEPNALLRAPHPQSSQKGIDTLYIERAGKKKALVLTIGEDKATKNPRTTIREEVWSSFAKFESKERDAELVSEVAALLKGEANAKALVEAALWTECRRYRVAITTEKGRTAAERKKLFKGYSKTVKGECVRRRADTFHIVKMRKWMDGFAKKVVAQLKTIGVA
jgi:hypothetical protein